MSTHRTEPGVGLIEALGELGQVLGYEAVPELALPSVTDKSSGRVDLAWVGSSPAKQPLFLFEVDSSPSAGMIANAVKVLAVDSEVLQKPIFFFHVVASGGTESGRIASLAEQYRQHNYRVYLLAQTAGVMDLLTDVVEQHGRIGGDIDLLSLGTALVEGDWSHWPGFDVDLVLDLAENFHDAPSPLSVYAELTADVEPQMFRRRLVSKLVTRELEWTAGPAWRHPLGHKGLFGEQIYDRDFGVPVRLGLLSALEPSRREACFETLREWQEPGGPEGWGRIDVDGVPISMTYDAYFVGPATFLWAVVAALMDDVHGARAFVIRQRQLNRIYGVMSDLWQLHVCAPDERHHEDYETVRARLNESGGLSREVLTSPPRRYYEYGPDEEIVEVPPATQLREWVFDMGYSQPRSPAQPALAELSASIPYEGGCLTTEMTLAWLYRDPSDDRFCRQDPLLAWQSVDFNPDRAL